MPAGVRLPSLPRSWRIDAGKYPKCEFEHAKSENTRCNIIHHHPPGPRQAPFQLLHGIGFENIEDPEEDEEVETVLERIDVGREELILEVLVIARELVPQYGIDLLDVQMKRINYIEDVRKKVYERMNSERQRIASKYRSEGEGKRAEIVGMKERELNRIYSEAYKRAQEIKGEADAKATKIYASAYKLDPEFYSFLKTLDIYKSSIGGNSRAIMTTDSEIYRYLKTSRIR